MSRSNQRLARGMKESHSLWCPVLILLLMGGPATVGGGNACPPCPPSEETQCSWRGTARDECFYTVRGGAVTLQAAGNYYLLTCSENVTVDDTAVPRLPARRVAPKAVLEGCAPPRRPYSAALLALNVTVLDELVLSRVSARTALRSDHLTGLPQLKRLVLTRRTWAEGPGAPGHGPPAPPADMLAALTALTHLQLSNVALRMEGLMALPPSLQSLHLSECGLSSVPERALSRLTRLTRLALDEPLLTSLPPLSVAPALAAVTIGAALQALPPLNTLINATIGGALDVRLSGGCGSLQRLNVFNAAVTSLPADWLAMGECGELRELRVVSLRQLTAISDSALHGAGNLTTLAISGSPLLTNLPDTLLVTMRQLVELHLTGNGLLTLSQGVFSALTSLQVLDVSYNQLTAAALTAVTALPALTALRAGHNPLGDLCGGGGGGGVQQLQATQLSPLSLLTSLQSLSLPLTGLHRVCADWRRQLVGLRALDLRGNLLTHLTLQDLIWERHSGVQVSVDLRDNPISHAVLSAAEYARLQRDGRDGATAGRDGGGRGVVTAVLRVDALIQCDCSAYWMARAHADRLLPAALQGVRCWGHGEGRGPLLEQVDITTMVCSDASQCSAACSCQWRPHDDTLLVACNNVNENDNETAIWPPLHAVTAARVELDLSYNSMHRLPDAALPTSVRRLDLTHNNLTDLTPLLHSVRDDLTLRLRHNPLHCHCTQVNDLHRHRNQIEDYANVTCSNGSLVAALTPHEQCDATRGGNTAGAAVAAVGAAMLAAAGAVIVARSLLQRRIKAALRRRKYKQQPEPNYMYDGFLAFSHHDSEQADSVMEALEGGPSEPSGPRRLRLCVHHRDWIPGEWVPSAVVRSVERSRRTVALVSRHFAASVWARAELRHATARAAAGRGPGPVLVLLGPVPIDMRDHVRRHRVLRWKDPRLWDKLRRLLAPNAPNAPNAASTSKQCTVQ